AAEGDHRLVLHEEQHVFGQLSSHAAPAQVTLQLQDFAVAAAAQVYHLKRKGHAVARARRTERNSSPAPSTATRKNPARPGTPSVSLRGTLTRESRKAANPLTIASPKRR